MCDKFRDTWGEPTIEDLCDKYFRGQDFCIEHDWPSLEFLDANLKGQTSPFGIFINESGKVTNNRYVALLGNSIVTMESNVSSDVTIRHNSTLFLRAKKNTFVYVSIHDDAELVVVSREPGARIYCSHFGGKINDLGLIDKYYKKF